MRNYDILFDRTEREIHFTRANCSKNLDMMKWNGLNSSQKDFKNSTMDTDIQQKNQTNQTKTENSSDNSTTSSNSSNISDSENLKQKEEITKNTTQTETNNAAEKNHTNQNATQIEKNNATEKNQSNTIEVKMKLFSFKFNLI